MLTLSRKNVSNALNYPKSNTCYIFTAQELERDTKVFRLEDNKKGFQRPLNEDKVRDIQETLRSKNNYPYSPILCALVNNDLYVVDGQHRREAHIREKKNAYVFVIEGSLADANEVFIRDNGSSTRITKKHTIQISASEKNEFMTYCMEQYDMSLDQIAAFMTALSPGGDLGKLDKEACFTERQEDVAEIILSIWTNHKLWKMTEKSPNPTKGYNGANTYSSSEAYSGKTVLGALARMSKSKKTEDGYMSDKDIKKVVKEIQKTDWNKTTSQSMRRLSTITGKNGPKAMCDYIKREVTYGLGLDS